MPPVCLASLRCKTIFAASTVASVPTAALAHASDRGHVLLLPTGHYLVGGAIAVAASFLVLTVVRPNILERISRARLELGTIGDAARLPLSLLSFAVLAVLVAAGFFGSRDPLSNPLPLTVWTLLWVGLTLIQGVFGNLWHWINPWYGPWRAVSALLGRAANDPTPKNLPEWLGYWPAVLLLLVFAWFELVYPAPDDPARLAWAVGLYWLFQLRRHAGFRPRVHGAGEASSCRCFSAWSRASASSKNCRPTMAAAGSVSACLARSSRPRRLCP